MALTGMQFGPLCSIQWIVGPIGRGSTGTRRITSSWMTSRVTPCSNAAGLHGDEAEQHRNETEECPRDH